MLADISLGEVPNEYPNIEDMPHDYRTAAKAPCQHQLHCQRVHSLQHMSHYRLADCHLALILTTMLFSSFTLTWQRNKPNSVRVHTESAQPVCLCTENKVGLSVYSHEHLSKQVRS